MGQLRRTRIAHVRGHTKTHAISENIFKSQNGPRDNFTLAADATRGSPPATTMAPSFPPKGGGGDSVPSVAPQTETNFACIRGGVRPPRHPRGWGLCKREAEQAEVLTVFAASHNLDNHRRCTERGASNSRKHDPGVRLRCRDEPMRA